MVRGIRQGTAQRNRRLALPLVLSLGSCGTAFSQGLSNSEFEAYAGTRVVYDTNYFRIDNSLEDVGGIDPRGLADTIFSVYAGLTSQWQFARNQSVVFDAEISENRHDVYPEADYTGGNVLFRYDWAVGGATFGDIQYTRVVEPVDFANQDIPRIDFRTRQRASGSLNRKLTPRWTIGAGGGYTESEFESPNSQVVDRVDGFLRVTYESRQGNRLAFAGEVQERQNTGTNNLGFEEFSFGPEVLWKISQDLQASAELKYLERDPVDPTLAAFDGPTGNLRLRWGLSDKVDLTLDAFHIVSSLGDQLSNFAIIDGQALDIAWTVSRQLSYYIGARHEARDYELEPSLVPVPDLAPREDQLLTVNIGARWDPRRSLHLEAFAGTGNRSSNRQFRDFRYETYGFEFQYNFL